MPTFLIAYISTLIVFLVIDAIWLGIVAKDFYFSQLGDLMLEKPKLGIALAFYCVYMIGVVVFAVSPALDSGQWTHALMYGALLGFVAYGTYDITNMATLKNWPVTMSIVDMAWGTVLTGSSATIGFFITKAFS